jgi:hypothetical protein
LRERIVTRAFYANIEARPERDGPGARQILLEPGEQLAQRALTTEQQSMDVPRLRRAGSVGGLRGQAVALENNDVLETVGEGAGGRQPGYSGADHERLAADQS